jgi:hypothetical protein
MSNGIRLIKYAAPFLLLILWYSGTSAYEVCQTDGLKDIKWNNSSATYYINSSGGPSGSIAAIQEGMQTWTDVATSNFNFSYGGTTTITAHGLNDRSNIVTFGLLAQGTLAENAYWFLTSNGRLLDSDVRFNTYYSWSTTGSPGTYDIQNVGTHEHGHSLCLKDLYSGADTEKTMYGSAPPGETKKQTLDPDDIDGITYLYLCPNLKTRIEGTSSEYDVLQDAYDNTADMGTFQSQATVFVEDLFIDIDKTVYLKAGYDCSYSDNILISTINGDMTITAGTLTIESGTLELQ